MRVRVNGQEYEFDSEIAVDALLHELKFERVDGIAVAINYHVAPRTSFSSITVRDGDEVEIIRAVQGG